MSKPTVSVVLNFHNEPTGWSNRCVAAVTKQMDPPDFEIVIVLDRATKQTTADVETIAEAANGQGPAISIVVTDHGDLGLARNEGVKRAEGRFIQFCDGDDMIGSTWLRDAFKIARGFDNDDFVLHPEFNLMFGAAQFFHRHIGDDSPEFSPKQMIQFNAWSALAFAPKSVFERFPYEPADDVWTNEDWHWNTKTLGDGIKHRVVPDSVHFVRMKLDSSSMSNRNARDGGALRKRDLFDRRDLPDQQIAPLKISNIPEAVYKQALFAHHEVGEKQIFIDPSMQVRTYPPAVIFEDQAWLRDQIGDAKHVVLVQTLPGGGAEKYALNWAKATGAKVIETAPVSQEASDVIKWFPRRILQPNEAAMALQRALIQSELDSVFVCNSEMGWGLLHENPACLAKKVFAASFAAIPLSGGFSSCPPFHVKHLKGVTIVTDNERHAKTLADYNGALVRVIHPRAEYAGRSKLSARTRERRSVLWAGRGTPDKQPNIVADLALRMPDTDFHVWGDVPRVPNALDNLKYRGPFKDFDAIDGSYDCYLMTSINEGMPHTALEASMAGLPVVAPDVGDLAKIAAKTFPMQIGRPVQLGAIIETLLDALKTPVPASALPQEWANRFDRDVTLAVFK